MRCNGKGVTIMTRFIFSTVSMIALATAMMSPALALTDRFDDARQDTINRLGDRFDDAREGTINRLNDRFGDAREQTINRLNDRFSDAYGDNLNR
jgi:hypothetical protein